MNKVKHLFNHLFLALALMSSVAIVGLGDNSFEEADAHQHRVETERAIDSIELNAKEQVIRAQKLEGKLEKAKATAIKNTRAISKCS